MGCAVADLDNDGDLDVYVTNWGPDSLYLNRGNGTFRNATQAFGAATGGWSTSAAFLDFDRDGFLDLFVTRYVAFDPDRRCAQQGGRRDYCGPTVFPGVADVLLRNVGGQRFENVSAAAGITDVEDAGLGVVAADLDDDGWIDLYVANDADPNNLWLNQRDGTFVDDAVLLGAAFNRFGTGEAGMGVTAGDADEDGDLDLFVTHLITETNTYYRNLALPGFEDATSSVRLGTDSLDLTGFGTAFFDADLDGDLDLAVANGAVKRRPERLGGATGWRWSDYVEPNLLFVNLGGDFERVASESPTFGRHLEVSRALLPADLDRDGDLDLVVTNIEGPTRLYRNESELLHWLEVELVDPELGREAIGARVSIETPSGTRVRHAIPPGGYLSAASGRIHLGLGHETEVIGFLVRWPDGSMERFAGTKEVDRPIALRKGSGQRGDRTQRAPK